jgi:SagB-type dehydrogenase family enzyme
MSQLAWTIHRATSYSSGLDAAPPLESTDDQDRIELPESQRLDLQFEDALAQRACCRRFLGTALSSCAISTLLGAGYRCGQMATFGGARWPSRPVPSAGAKYPLEVHLLVRAVDGVPPGCYRYLPDEHALATTGPAVPFPTLPAIFLGQSYVVSAAAILIIGGRLNQTTERYGDRGYRYVLLEAGHVAQNIGLAATGLDVGCLYLGGFLDDALATLLCLRPDVVPLYGIALGSPDAHDRSDVRQIR